MNIQKSLYTARCAGAHSDRQPSSVFAGNRRIPRCGSVSHLTGMERQEKATPKMATFKHTLPARPRPGLSAEFQVRREIKGNSGLFRTQKKFRTFFLLGAEKVLVPLRHTLALTKVTAASQSRHRRRPQPRPKRHLPPASRAGMPARGAGADGCDGAAESERAFPAAALPWSQLAFGADTDTTDRHAHTAHGPESLYKRTLGPAAARASHFLLHVVVQLEFGLVGQLHGPVLQLLGNGCEG